MKKLVILLVVLGMVIFGCNKSVEKPETVKITLTNNTEEYITLSNAEENWIIHPGKNLILDIDEFTINHNGREIILKRGDRFVYDHVYQVTLTDPDDPNAKEIRHKYKGHAVYNEMVK